MTRVLDFEGHRGPRRFELLLAALLAAGDGKGERTPQIIRKEARLHDALDKVSVPSANGNGDDPMARVLMSYTGEAPTLVLPQEDFDLIQQYTEKCGWTPRVARDVVDLWDWLSAAEKR